MCQLWLAGAWRQATFFSVLDRMPPVADRRRPDEESIIRPAPIGSYRHRIVRIVRPSDRKLRALPVMTW